MSDGTAVDIYEPVIADLKSRIATLQAMLDNLESLRLGAPLQASAFMSMRLFCAAAGFTASLWIFKLDHYLAVICLW